MHAIISLRTQYSNLGDLLINVLLVSRLAARGKVTCDVANVPESYLAEFKRELGPLGAEAEYIASRSSLIRRVGGLLAGGQEVVFMLSPGDNMPSYSLQRLIMGVVSRLGPRLFLAQVGASWQTPSALDGFMLRGAAKRAGLLSVRDTGSQARLRAVGVPATLVPDLAFLQPVAHPGGNLFLMTFRERAAVPFDALASRLQPLIAQARAAGLAPGFCWQVAGDEALARKLAEACGADVVQAAPGRPTLAQMRELYRRAAVICSNRLHGLLLGAGNGALPMACLSAADSKVSGAFAAAGLDPFVSAGPAGDAQVLAALLQAPDDHHRLLGTAFARSSEALEAYFQTLIPG